MANKVAPKISKPGSHRFPQKGPHNPNVGTSGKGMAPRPTNGPPDHTPAHPPMHGLARVANRPSSPTGKGNAAGSFTPVQNNANANLVGPQIGQQEYTPPPGARIGPHNQNPVTGNAVATHKPQRKGKGAAFFGEF